jgi:hypothetical protein
MRAGIFGFRVLARRLHPAQIRHVSKLRWNGREDKEEIRGSPDAARDSGNGVRCWSGFEKDAHRVLERISSFSSSAVRRKEAEKVWSV